METQTPQDKMSQISLQLTASLYDNLHPSNAAKILMKLIKTKTDIFKSASIKHWDCFISSTMGISGAMHYPTSI